MRRKTAKVPAFNFERGGSLDFTLLIDRYYIYIRLEFTNDHFSNTNTTSKVYFVVALSFLLIAAELNTIALAKYLCTYTNFST